MKLPAIFAMLLFLNGCTQAISPAIKNYNTIQPGAIQTKQLGEALFEKGTVTVLPGFKAERDSDLPLMGHVLFPPVKRGDVWTCDRYLKNDYLCFNYELKMDGVQDYSDGNQPEIMPYFIIGRDGDFRGLYYPIRGYTLALDDPLLRGLFKPVEVPQSGSFKQELIYSGKRDDNIRFVYREFREDLSSPSLFKTLNYNLSSLDIVRFDDTIIEVIEATSSFIRYRIK